MKKIVFILLVAFAVNNVNAATLNSSTTNKKIVREERKSERISLRKLRDSEVSYFSQQNFEGRYKNAANVSWSRQDYFDVANFTLNNKSMTAYYDYDNKLVGTLSPSVFNELPSSAQNFINKHYKDYTIEKVIFYDDNEDNSTDMIIYGMQFEDSDSYFVELSNGTKQIVLHILNDGNVDFFKKL